MVTLTDETVLVDVAGQREFRLLRCLGEGGFGSVYLARQRSAGGLEQRVAVKILRSDVDKRARAVERLRDEAAVLASLHHPVILVAHDLVQLDDRIALVTEYVEGQDLRECLTDPDDPMPLSVLIDVVGQVAGALDAAFSTAGIVHRDVKPENIRIGRHGNVKLLDFGIAKSVTGPGRTQSNAVVGSVAYLAPERFDRRRALTPASDVFALGCVLLEGITGRALFDALELPELVGLVGTPADLDGWIGERLAEVEPPLVRELLASMLDRDPDARLPASEVPSRCDAIGAGLPDPITLRTWCRSRRWVELPQDEGLSSAERGIVWSGPRAEPTADLERMRTVTLSSGQLSHARPGRDGWRWAGLLGAALAAGLFIGVGVVGLGAFGFVIATKPPAARPDEARPDEARPDEAPPDAAHPVEVAPAPEPTPDPAPAQAHGAPPPAPVVMPMPIAVAPEPVPEGTVRDTPLIAEVESPDLPPLPEPVVISTSATVTLVDAIPVELRDPPDRVFRPGALIPAGTWQIWADFAGKGFVPAGTLTLAPGAHVNLDCDAIAKICEERIP